MSELTSSNFSETDASNNAAVPNGFPEGMSPSGVNDSSRAFMGAVKRWFNRTSGAYTAGGGTTAYTLSPSVALTAYADEMWSWIMPSTNAVDATMNISTLGARNIQKLTTAGYANVAAGDLPSGAFVLARYSTSASKFYVVSVLPALADLTGPAFYGRSTGTGAGQSLSTLVATNLLLANASFGLKQISGWTYANNGSDATNDLDIAAGAGADSTGAYWIKTAALTKQSDNAWAVGNNAGGLDTGAVGNNDYYIHAIARSDTGVTDVLYSLSATSPTMPANYDYRRLIGWFKRSGGAIVAFTTSEMAGGGLDFRWTTSRLDIDLTSTLTTSRRTDALSVPLNFSVTALIRTMLTDASANFNAIICSPDETDGAPSATAVPLLTHSMATLGSVATGDMAIKTSATGTIAARATIATVDAYRVATLGFQWSRR